MRKLEIAYGNSCFTKIWSNKTIAWDELVERLRHTIRTPETVREYPKLPKGERDKIKDKGGFVGGHLREGRRKKGNVEMRSMLTHDTDHAEVGFIDRYSNECKYTSCIYSTHGHTPEAPRLRIITPLTRAVTPEEYVALSRYVAAEWGIEQFDGCSYLPHQLMYWASTPSDGEYIYLPLEGEWLDPDKYLEQYPNWKDFSLLPTSSKESVVINRDMKRQADPLAKSGVVGAFCRTFGVEEAMERFLEDLYTPSVIEGRYDYIPADSSAGVVIYDGKWVYSHHATDPAHGKLLNAFDLVRAHLFGDLDEDAGFKAMAEFAVRDKTVSMEMLEERRQKNVAAFADWEEGLERAKNGKLINNLHNIRLILENDPKLSCIVFNEHIDGMEVKGEAPWKRPKDFPYWRDADDAQLICYIDENYDTFGKQNLLHAVTKVADDRSYHPIREFLASLPPWDGTARVDTLLVDYFGADDTPYVRAVTRKTMCAAVLRVQQPGIKFDHMLVLEDRQGTGKSTFLSKLGRGWFSDSLSLGDLQDKTGAEKLQGNWILEISELEGIHKADVNRVKAFISRQDDKYRAAFGRRVTPHPRQCVIIATVNPEKGYLRDTTGNRRFFPVRLHGAGSKSSWDMTEEEVFQIWAETLELAVTEKLYLSKEMEKVAEAHQRDAMETDDNSEGLIRDYLEMLLPENWETMTVYDRKQYVEDYDHENPTGTIQREMVCTAEIWYECYRQSIRERPKQKDSLEIAAILKRIGGWEKPPNATKRFRHYGTQSYYKRV